MPDVAASDRVQVHGHACEASLALHAADAEGACAAALHVAEAAFGPRHSQILWQLSLVGQERLSAGDPKTALTVLERAAALAADPSAARRDVLVANAYYAVALARSGDRPHARAVGRLIYAELATTSGLDDTRHDLVAALPELASSDRGR